MKTGEQVVEEWQSARAAYIKAVAEWKIVKAAIAAATAPLMVRLKAAQRAKDDARARWDAAKVGSAEWAAEHAARAKAREGFVPAPENGGYSIASRESEERLGEAAYKVAAGVYAEARKAGATVEAAINAANHAVAAGADDSEDY